MEELQEIQFTWNENSYAGHVEKEYENSFLIVVMNPCSEMTEKYMNRMIVSKKHCTVKA